MGGFGGEGDGCDLGGQLAEGLGGLVVFVEVRQQGIENGAGFRAGALRDVGLRAGGHGGEIGVPAFGMPALLAEVVVVAADDAERGERLGGGPGIPA